jgi:hypothetical protein
VHQSLVEVAINNWMHAHAPGGRLITGSPVGFTWKPLRAPAQPGKSTEHTKTMPTGERTRATRSCIRCGRMKVVRARTPAREGKQWRGGAWLARCILFMASLGLPQLRIAGPRSATQLLRLARVIVISERSLARCVQKNILLPLPARFGLVWFG